MSDNSERYTYRPVERTQRVGTSDIPVIRAVPTRPDKGSKRKVTFIPGGSYDPARFPELEKLKERFRKERSHQPRLAPLPD